MDHFTSTRNSKLAFVCTVPFQEITRPGPDQLSFSKAVPSASLRRNSGHGRVGMNSLTRTPLPFRTTVLPECQIARAHVFFPELKLEAKQKVLRYQVEREDFPRA